MHAQHCPTSTCAHATAHPLRATDEALQTLVGGGAPYTERAAEHSNPLTLAFDPRATITHARAWGRGPRQ